MAEQQTLEVIPFQEGAGVVDELLNSGSNYSLDPSAFPSTSASASAPASPPPANPDYYIYDKESYNESYAVPQAKNLFGANLDVLEIGRAHV